MGFTRKLLSASTLGLVDWRSDRERVAKYTKQARDDQRRAIAAALERRNTDGLKLQLAGEFEHLAQLADGARLLLAAPVSNGGVEAARTRLARIRDEALGQSDGLRGDIGGPR